MLASRTPLAALEQAFDSLPRAQMERAADPASLGGPAAQTLRGVGILAREPRLRASDSEQLSRALRELLLSRSDLWVWRIFLQGPEP